MEEVIFISADEIREEQEETALEVLVNFIARVGSINGTQLA